MSQTAELIALLVHTPAVMVRVHTHRGSVPREADAWMAVFEQTIVGTIGGGQLEWQAITQARAHLASNAPSAVIRYPLGPALGQCCGGEVELRFTRVGAAEVPALRQQFEAARANWPWVVLFGGGHVGSALVRLFANLPLRVKWIDSRDGIFPTGLPDNVEIEWSEPVQSAVPDLPAGAQVLIMSFSHAQDLDLVAACLSRQQQRADLAAIGLIGSKSKWAAFRHRLGLRGFSDTDLAQVKCPIGLSGIRGKQPEVIAVAVAAQVLQARQPNGDPTDH